MQNSGWQDWQLANTRPNAVFARSRDKCMQLKAAGKVFKPFVDLLQ
jgi:hypothetical protein